MKLAAVVLAAGKGTRMKSARAKVLHAVAGRPMIEYPVALARSLGAERVVCVLGHEADSVEAAIAARFGAGAVEVALQAEQRGTGHATQMAGKALAGFKGAVLILYGDVPLLTAGTLERLVAARGRRPLSLVTMRMADPKGYGRIVRDGKDRVTRIVEDRDCSEGERAITEVNAGIYCVDAAFLFATLKRLRPDNAQGELYLTDVVARAAEQGGAAAVDAPVAEMMGVNDRVDLAAADAAMRRRLCESLMRAGVTIHLPESCLIEPGVTVGADSEIGPSVTLRGATRVGKGALIEAGCIVHDAVLGDGVHLKPYCVIAESEVGAHAHIGPFAHLRPGSVLGEEVKIGNFVETKKARMGRGAKASHLSYLGDAEIGAGANIGCGTITCNYDGYKKSKTVIGEGAFIGSDTQLVAPVTVGARAVIAAGTTVVEDVAEGALALSRAAQVQVPGYYERKRLREQEAKRLRDDKPAIAAKTGARRRRPGR